MCNELPELIILGQYTDDLHKFVKIMIQNVLRKKSQEASANNEVIDYNAMRGNFSYLPLDDFSNLWKYNFFSEYVEATHTLYINLQYLGTFPSEVEIV